MQAAIDELLERHGGACSRAELLAVLTEAQLGNEIRAHRLERAFPRAFVRPWRADEPDVRDCAALASVGQPAVISHTSALRRWGLDIATDAGEIHVTIPIGRRVNPAPGLVVHTTSQRVVCVKNRGVFTATPEHAVVQSWTTAANRRAIVIESVRRGLTSADRLAAIIDASRRLPRRQELLVLADLLSAGCESELEIWGHLNVFDAPGLGHGKQQVTVRVDGKRYRIDRAYEVERVAVELDGDQFHSTKEQRERDRRRDVALATQGWLTVRFSHRRLTTDPQGCRRELLEVLASRRGSRA